MINNPVIGKEKILVTITAITITFDLVLNSLNSESVKEEFIDKHCSWISYQSYRLINLGCN